MRRRLPTITAWFFALLFTGLAAREHFARGGPGLARTIASHSSTSPKSAEETVLLFEEANRVVPRGAEITVLKPLNRNDDQQVLRFSHGQLPYHRVVPQSEQPDFIITLGAPLNDPRYEQIASNPAGMIWRRTRW
ncbi:MAG TPA: hypothetical protein VND45_08065 [Thermoanaerobaculia bacterium]|nr:hypothetical protein [Thermoanaerobaculia bacterium]